MAILIHLFQCQSAPNGTHNKGNDRGEVAQFLRDIRSVQNLSSLSGSLSNYRGRYCHCAHSSERIRKKEGDVSGPRGDGDGRSKRWSTIPAEAMQNTVEYDGPLLSHFHSVVRRGGREGLGGRFAGSFDLCRPFPGLLHSEKANEDERQPNGELHKGRGRIQSGAQPTNLGHAILQSKGKNADDSGRNSVAHTPKGTNPASAIPPLSTAAG